MNEPRRVVCAFCGVELDEAGAEHCASCSELMCSKCGLGGFCPNCVTDDDINL